MVERKKLSQWFFNISKFSQNLLDGLEKLESMAQQSKNNAKIGLENLLDEIEFEIEGDLPIKNIKCFTTRPDTLFGFSSLAVSVDHEISNFYKQIRNL